MDVLKRNKKGSHPIELIDDGMLDELLGKLDDILWADHIKNNTPMIPKIHVDADKPRSEKVKKIPEEKKSASTNAKKVETAAEKGADDNEDGGNEEYGPYDEGDDDHLGIYKDCKNYLLSQPSTQELPFVCQVGADGEFRIPMVSQYGTPPVYSQEEKDSEEDMAKNLDDAFKEFDDCIEKIKITMTEVLRLHPNSEMILSRKTSWIATVRKHLKDVADNEEGDVESEKTPTPVKNTGLLTQGNQSPFSPMTSSVCAEIDELISAIQSSRHPGTQSKAEGIQPVNLQSELDNVATTSSIRDTEHEGNALLQYKLQRPKRNTNLPDAPRSPYVQRVVSLTDKREQLESTLASCILSATGNKWDVIFDCPAGVLILRSSFETIYPELCLDADIISAWAVVLNHEERLRAPSTPARLFCNAGMLVAGDFEETEEYINSMFCSRMETILGQAVSKDIRNFQMVFVPVLYNTHYILVFFNLAQSQILVIDNIEGDVHINIRYSGYVEKVVRTLPVKLIVDIQYV
ncbi:putative papain-like cysteine peptidase superfamily [Helianthus anomalus]